MCYKCYYRGNTVHHWVGQCLLYVHPERCELWHRLWTQVGVRLRGASQSCPNDDDKTSEEKTKYTILCMWCVCVYVSDYNFYFYLAHHSLQDSIKSTLWSISIPGHPLFPHLLSEACYLVRQWQHILESELSLACLLNSVYIEQVTGGIGNQGRRKIYF